MTNPHPTFSIVVPIYNEEQFIREALDSILAQTDPDWEALLVDDGSTDSTPEILDEYARNDPRFRVFHKPNGGQSTAINKGVQEARGEWICWLSADDFYYPDKLQLNRKWIQEYPNYRFFFAECQYVYADKSKIDHSYPWLDLNDEVMRLIFLFRTNFVSGISICIKRETWLRSAGFNENLHYAHDLDMWLRLMLTNRAHYEPQITCSMRFHSEQESNLFPLGCLIDASKTIIRLINEHTYQELIPFAKEAKEMTEIEILRKTLDFVATVNDSNLLYGLGYHPALQIRILEWAWSFVTNTDLALELQNCIRDRSLDLSQIYTKTPFGLLWLSIYAATSIPKPRFKYFTVDPAEVGRVNYYLQNTSKSEMAQALQAYLQRFDNIQFTSIKDRRYLGREIALLLPSDFNLDNFNQPELVKILEICQGLTRMGINLILLGRSDFSLGFINGYLYLGANDNGDIDCMASVMATLDMIIPISWKQYSDWDTKIQNGKVILEPNLNTSNSIKKILAIVPSREMQFPNKKSIFEKIREVILKI